MSRRYLKDFKERRHGLGVISTVSMRRFDDPGWSEFNRASLLGIVDAGTFSSEQDVGAVGMGGWLARDRYRGADPMLQESPRRTSASRCHSFESTRQQRR